MTNDNKPPMFGPTVVFDPANYEPRSGKTPWMYATYATVVNNGIETQALIGNCTTRIPFKLDFGPNDIGHTFVLGTARGARSGMVARPSLLPLAAPSQFAAAGLITLGCQRKALESDGVSLADLSRVLVRTGDVR